MTERQELVHKVVNELRVFKEAPPFHPTADIDMVWVISQPGTVKKVSKDGIYEGFSNDRKVVEYGIKLVEQITALRADRSPEALTKEDIEESGPTLYYNGEDRDTQGSAYSQNEDFKEMTQEPGFPIPESKIVIDHISQLGTHSQVKGFADYLQHLSAIPKKIAVVSMVHHSRRVSRYLAYYRGLFPEDITFLNAPVAETDNTVGTTLREARKVVKYVEKGDMSEEPLEGF